MNSEDLFPNEKLDLLILSQDAQTYTIRELARAAQKKKLRFQILDYWSPMTFCNVKLWASLGRRQFDHQMHIYKLWESQGAQALNSSASILKSFHKKKCFNILNHNNLKCIHTESIYDDELSASQLDFIHNSKSTSFVIKSAAASQGRAQGVISKDNFLQKSERINFIMKLREEIQNFENKAALEFVFQPFYEESSGEDIRVFFLNGEMWSYKRTNKNNYRSNLHIGGKASKIDCCEEIKRMTEQACQHLGLNLAGVDFLMTNDGPQILEVNPCPGFEGLDRTYQFNLADRLVDELVSRDSNKQY